MEVEDRTGQHTNQLTDLQNTIKSLVAKSDDVENQIRRNNVRVLGLLEGSEGGQTADFAKAFFKHLLRFTDISPTYMVERAHRVPMGRPIPGTPPPPFLVRFLNYRNGDRILSGARKHPNVQYGNAHIITSCCFLISLRNLKKNIFTEVRRRLRGRNIKYGMLYPSRL